MWSTMTVAAATTARRRRKEARRRGRSTFGVICFVAAAATVALLCVPIAKAAAAAVSESESPELGVFEVAETEARSAGGGVRVGLIDDDAERRRYVGGTDDGVDKSPPDGGSVSASELPASWGRPRASGVGDASDSNFDENGIGPAAAAAASSPREKESRWLLASGGPGTWHVDYIEDSFVSLYSSVAKQVEYQFEFSSGRNYTVTLYDYECQKPLNYSLYFDGAPSETVDSNYTGNGRDRVTVVAEFVDDIQRTDLFEIIDGGRSANIGICVQVELLLYDPYSDDSVSVSFRKVKSLTTLNAGMASFSFGASVKDGNPVSSEASTIVPGPLNCSQSFVLDEGPLEVTLCYYRLSGFALPYLTFYEPDCETPLDALHVQTKGEPDVTETGNVTLLEVKVWMYADELVESPAVYSGAELNICVKVRTGKPAEDYDGPSSRRTLFPPEPPAQQVPRVQRDHQRQRRLNYQESCGYVSFDQSLSVAYDPTTATANQELSTEADPDPPFWCHPLPEVMASVDPKYEIQACQCRDNERTCIDGAPALRQNMPLRLCLSVPSNDVRFQVITSCTIQQTGGGTNIFRPVRDRVEHVLADVFINGREAYIDAIVPSKFFQSAAGSTVTVTGYADLKFATSRRRRHLSNAGETKFAPRRLPPLPDSNFKLDVALSPLDRGEDDVLHNWREEKVPEDTPAPTVQPDVLRASTAVQIESPRRGRRPALFLSALLAGILILV